MATMPVGGGIHAINKVFNKVSWPKGGVSEIILTRQSP
jgi:hypothetical protein